MTGQELTQLVMDKLELKRPGELAARMGLTAYSSPRRVGRWLDGENEPEFEPTIQLLDLVGAINWEVLKPSPSGVEEAQKLSKKNRRRTRGALGRAEEARDQPRPGTDRSHGG